MKTIILSREKLREFFSPYLDHSNYVLIEIKDVDNDEILSYPDDVRFITLSFDDVADPESPTVMTKEHACTIVDFINSNKDSFDTLIVSCTHGVSRSAAVAAAINYALGEDDWFIWENYSYGPNPYCYNLLLETFGADTSLVEEKYFHNSELLSILYKIAVTENGVEVFNDLDK